jgi:hypothetical protein
MVMWEFLFRPADFLLLLADWGIRRQSCLLLIVWEGW